MFVYHLVIKIQTRSFQELDFLEGKIRFEDMATHFICQPTEPLGHYYSLQSYSSKLTHGAVSELELINMGEKSHNQFPPPGWDTSQSSEDSLPLCKAPVPTWNITSNVIGPDPQLCITPLKSTIKKCDDKQHTVYPEKTPDYPVCQDPDLCITPEKDIATKLFSQIKQQDFSNLENNNEKTFQHKVRFDVSNSECFVSSSPDLSDGSFSKLKQSKTYQPTNYTEQEFCDRSEKTLQPQFVKSQGKYISKSVLEGKQEPSDYEPALPKQQKVTTDRKEKVINMSVRQKKKMKGINQGVATTSKPLCIAKSIPNRKVRVTRETEERPVLNDYEFPFSGEGDGTELHSEHVFLRPEYNSTLRLRQEIDSIKECSVDVMEALQKKLKISESTTSIIREKASSMVNPSECQFEGLVSLDIPLEDLKSQIEKTHSKRMKFSRPNTQVSKSNEPDLMEFFSPDLMKTWPELSTPGLSYPSEKLGTAQQLAAFDMYRHNRVWEKTSYFKRI